MPASIGEQLKILVELQKIDAVVFQLKKELEGHPAQLQGLADQFEKKKAGVKAAEDDLKACQLKQKQKEGDLQSREEKIKKLQSQLYSLKTNKEYAAMELEIKGLKADNSVLEEDILKLLDAVDEAKKKVTEEKGRLGEEEKRFKESSDAVKKRSAEIEAEVQSLAEKRKAFPAGVEPRLLSQYERVLKGREGLAIVPVEDARACGGCHMVLPPQRVNEVHLQDKVIVCEECARILYWPS